MEQEHRRFMDRAIALALEHSRSGLHGPFGAVVVHEGRIVGEGWNRVVEWSDPTAHAEVNAIRAAGRHLGQHDLGDCMIYSSCEPCPLCLSAIYWSRIPTVYFAATGRDAQAIGFDDERLRQYLEDRKDGPKRVHLHHPGALEPLSAWMRNPKRRPY